MGCDQKKAINIAIDLARFILKKYNIPYENLVAHREVSLETDCPAWIFSHNMWDYFKSEVKKRDQNQTAMCFDPSPFGGSADSVGTNPDTTQTVVSNWSSNSQQINFDNREDWTNLKKVKGVTLICYPPYHITTIKTKDKDWKNYGYSKKFHYMYDGDWKKDIDKKLIAKSIQENNKHTYIERALYKNESPKYTLNIAMFVPSKITDYPKYEKTLIDKISEVIYENSLQTKDLWREFDFNRVASPFMYLDREQWKKMLREVDKLVKWRYENFGKPLKEEEDPKKTSKDYSKLKDDIKKKGLTSNYCLLREHPSMTSNQILALDPDTLVTIIDADTKGYYKVELEDKTKGWIVADSVNIIKEDNKTTTSKLLATSLVATKTKDKDKGIPKPEISATMTHKEYLAWLALTDPKLIDEYSSACEPYDKGLKEIIEAPVTNDDRLKSLTKKDTTVNNNDIHYAIVEGSPGDSGHCVKPSAELNALYKPNALKVDPIYPDLIVPPNYSPSDHNVNQQNPIPLSTLSEGTSIKDVKDFDNNQLTFDYELLNNKKKESKGKPINYLDPYPYDDKITELEKHHPKIKIDSIESRLYESNHPGDPLPQPVAKNFAMVYDAMLKQSANTEARLVKLENVLSQVLRSVGRIGSRVNVNCVYYGGQDTFGKYKTIRCLCDDRIHDACSVTLDQCLSCTRYEPILGQVYDILDDTGMNGSIYLDNMQMGYQNLEDLKNLNRVERRNSQYTFANVNKKMNKPKSQIEEWEKADKDAYIKQLKKKTTDSKELEKLTKNIKQEDYAFKMNWYEQDLDLQEPDVKPYPLEGIKKRYKKTDLGNKGEDDNNNLIEEKTDQDVIKDMTDIEKLNNGQWIDTREKADTVETNEYSSEDYYFEDFNKLGIAYEGINGNGTVSGVFGAEARKKIVEKAKEIVDLHAKGKAGYSQGSPPGNRTVDDTKRVTGSNPYLSNVFVYDCSSMVSCCYKYAGLNSMYDKNTYAQVKEISSNGGEMWAADEEGLKKAKPGDLIFTHEGMGAVLASMFGKYIPTQHVMIYIGDNKIAHASTQNKPVPKQIRIDDVSVHLKPYNFFARPKDLIDADKNAANNNITSAGGEITGSITTSTGEKFNTIYSFPKAVVTGYTDYGYGANGCVCSPVIGNVAASHNMPYGTVIYVKHLDGKAGGGIVKNSNGKVMKNLGQPKNGVFYVGDTGGPLFDFDLNTNAFSAKENHDVVVLEWGKDTKAIATFTDIIKMYIRQGRLSVYRDAVQSYKKMNGLIINFHKFNNEDANLANNPDWQKVWN